MSYKTILTKTQIKVIKNAYKDQNYRVYGHGNTTRSLEEKGYVKYLGFNDNLGSVYGLTDKGITIYNTHQTSLF